MCPHSCPGYPFAARLGKKETRPLGSGLFPSASYKARSSKQVENYRYEFWDNGTPGERAQSVAERLVPRCAFYVGISSNRRPRIVVANNRIVMINRCKSGMNGTYARHLWRYGEIDAPIWKFEGW